MDRAKKTIIHILVTALVVTFAAAAVLIWSSFDQAKKNQSSNPAPQSLSVAPLEPGGSSVEGRPAQITAIFECDQNKSLIAIFNNQADSSVDLILSDSRNLNLPQTVSADGARYANADESLIFWNKGDGAFLQEQGQTTFMNCSVKKTSGPEAVASSSSPAANETASNSGVAGLANPASANCEKQGGRVNIKSKSDGSQYGLCYFDDNRACEEWAMLRGDCPVGGRKTTGYDTIAQEFCAWSGGQTFAVPDAVCTFKDGSTCPAEAFYAGTCRSRENKE